MIMDYDNDNDEYSCQNKNPKFPPIIILYNDNNNDDYGL